MNKSLKTIFNEKNLKFLILGIILIIAFKKSIVMISTIVALAYLGVFTIKISKVVPHISAETVTASSILIGYLYGWHIGLIFGLAVGMWGFINASQINLTVLIVVLVMGFVGVLGSLFKNLGYPFWMSYLIIYFIRANLTFFLMYVVKQNIVENIMHSYVESIYNMAVIINFMNIIYAIVIAIS